MTLTLHTTQPDASVIEALKDLLSRAERGEIRFLVAVIDSKQETFTATAGTPRNFAQVIGLLEISKRDYLEQVSK